MLVRPARSSAPNASSGKRAGGVAVAVGGARGDERQRVGPAEPVEVGPGGSHARTSGSRPRPRARATSGSISATVSSQPSRVAPGPSPSWARTIAPSSMPRLDRGEHRVGRVAAPIVRVGAPADDAQPARRGGRAGPLRLDAPRRAPEPGLHAELAAARSAPGRDPRRPPRRRARCGARAHRRGRRRRGPRRACARSARGARRRGDRGRRRSRGRRRRAARRAPRASTVDPDHHRR